MCLNPNIMEKKRKEELRLRRGFFKITARDVCGDKIKTFFYIMFWGLLIRVSSWMFRKTDDEITR